MQPRNKKKKFKFAKKNKTFTLHGVLTDYDDYGRCKIVFRDKYYLKEKPEKFGKTINGLYKDPTRNCINNIEKYMVSSFNQQFEDKGNLFDVDELKENNLWKSAINPDGDSFKIKMDFLEPFREKSTRYGDKNKYFKIPECLTYEGEIITEIKQLINKNVKIKARPRKFEFEGNQGKKIYGWSLDLVELRQQI